MTLVSVKNIKDFTFFHGLVSTFLHFYLVWYRSLETCLAFSEPRFYFCLFLMESISFCPFSPFYCIFFFLVSLIFIVFFKFIYLCILSIGFKMAFRQNFSLVLDTFRYSYHIFQTILQLCSRDSQFLFQGFNFLLQPAVYLFLDHDFLSQSFLFLFLSFWCFGHYVLHFINLVFELPSLHLLVTVTVCLFGYWRSPALMR